MKVLSRADNYSIWMSMLLPKTRQVLRLSGARGLLSRFFVRLSKRKRETFLVVVWALAISLVFIKVHWIFYLETPRFKVYKLALSYRGPQLGSVDLLVLAIASLVISIVFVEVQHVIYGYIVALGLSSLISIVYTFLYIWYVLEWGGLLRLVPGGWEWAVLWAILNVMWVMFPSAVLVCLFGAVVGYVLRSWVKP